MPLRNLLRSPVVLLGAMLLAPFLPLLLAPGGRVLGNPACDNPSMFFFINEFAGRCWRQGTVPLWNPHILLGLPFLGEGQAAVFHPLSALFILLPAGVAINWLIALSFLLTGLFFYGYLRALDLGRPAAAGGALIWCASNVLIPRLYAGHLTILLESIEIPLILMLWERYRRSRAPGYLAGLSLAYGAMILAAFPQILYLFSLFFMGYVLLQAAPACTSPARAREEGRAILMLGLFVLLGIGIGAVQLLPSADFAAQSFRRALSYEYCSAFSFAPANLLMLLAPRIFGLTPEPGPVQYWGQGNFWEMSLYIGMLPLVLAFAGLATAPARRRITLGACALVFFLLALGDHTPLFPLAYQNLPFFNLFRGPARNMLIVEFCLVTFSAYGIQSLLSPAGGATHRRGGMAALLGASVLLALVVELYVFLIPGADAADSHWRMLMTLAGDPAAGPVESAVARSRAVWASHELARSAGFLVLTLGVLALAWRGKWRRALPAALFSVMLADLLWVFLPLLQTYDGAITSLPRELAAPLQDYPYPARVLLPGHWPNLAMRHGFSSPSGYAGNTLTRFNNFVNAIKGLPPRIPQLADPLPSYDPRLRFLAFDAAWQPSPAGIIDRSRVLASASGGELIRFPEPFPRAFLAATPRRAASEREALRYVLTAGAALQDSPVIEAAALPADQGPLGAGETVQFVSFTPNRVELRVQAARPRVLVLGEAFEKNWSATVNGRPASIFPANYLFRGVTVPAGQARVVFEYRSAAFRRGALISLLSLLSLAAMGLYAKSRYR